MPVEANVKVIGYDKNSTIVEVVIHNGKTHQIRAQLAAHGHFILGDGKYGRDDINNKFGVKNSNLRQKNLFFLLIKAVFCIISIPKNRNLSKVEIVFFNGALDFLERLFSILEI